MVSKLREAIQNRDVQKIRQLTSAIPVADLADIIEGLNPQNIVLFFLLLKTETQSTIFSHLEPRYQEQLIRSFTEKQIDEIVGDLYANEIADLIEEIPSELQTRIIQSINDKETREKVNRLLKFSENQTGSVMNVDFTTISENQTLSSALNQIRSAKDSARLAHYFFVVNKLKKLVGYVALEDLVFGSPRQRVGKIMRPAPYVLNTTDKQEAAKEFAKHDMSVLPVTNAAQEIVGFIAADDMIDVINQIATEEARKSAGITAAPISYAQTSVWKLFKSRILWLLLLMISATLSQIVLDSFQKISDSTFNLHTEILVANLTTAIVAILPVISGAAGNAGSQSSATIIRALATGDISSKDYLKVFRKELGASSIIGGVLAVANFLRLVIYYLAAGDFSNSYVVLSAAASLAIFVVIVLAQVVGGMLPLLGKRLKIDPAVMAAPLLTTIIDALSILIFFGISIGVMLGFLG